MARSAKTLVRKLVPFPVRLAVVRLRENKRYREEKPQFQFTSGSLQAFPYSIGEHRSPLRRPGTTYEADLQRGKETNVGLVAKHICGTILPPGREFSYHHAVGEPTPARGFVNGAELHDGELKPGIGGGACQVSNLLYVLALLSGCTITQRHRHGLDLFPDSERTIPFGCGATVYFPNKDLRFINSNSFPILIELVIEDGHLVGRMRATEPLNTSWRIVEIDGSFRKEGDRWMRRNTVARIKTTDGHDSEPEVVAENVAVCLYDPEANHEGEN